MLAREGAEHRIVRQLTLAQLPWSKRSRVALFREGSQGRAPVSLSKVATIRSQANEAPVPRVGAIVSLPEFRIKALPEDVYIYVSNEL